MQTFLLTSRCPVCENFVEIHPLTPEGPRDEAWRLEMHDETGRTIRPGYQAPRADALMPNECVECGSWQLSKKPAGEDVEASCFECGHTWLTGHLNDLSDEAIQRLRDQQ